MKNNYPDELINLINRKWKDDDFRKYPLIVRESLLEEIVENDPVAAGYYKRLFDGTLFTNVIDESDNDQIYIFTSLSAFDIVIRIKSFMDSVELTEDSTFVELENEFE